jgi:hypothetical protein
MDNPALVAFLGALPVVAAVAAPDEGDVTAVDEEVVAVAVVGWAWLAVVLVLPLAESTTAGGGAAAAARSHG